jgi:hypothetical protein
MTIKNTSTIFLLAAILFALACPLYSAHASDNMAALVFDEEIFGKITILDRQEDLVVELTKRVGRRLEIGLDEGEYLIINSPESRSFKAWITLEEGARFELSAEDLTPEDAEMRQEKKQDNESLPPAEELQLPKETLLSGKSSAYFYGEIGIKTIDLFDEFMVLVGGQLGWTFNNSFSVGFAGYARAEDEDKSIYWDCYRYVDYIGPAYGGITTAFIFLPKSLIHFKAGALFGAGYAWDRHFYIIEPEFDVVLNISQIVRIQAGISYPFTDKDEVGPNDVMFNVSFRFGK